MSICDGTCEPTCYGCEMRGKAVRYSSAVTPTQRNTVPGRRADPAWERGKVYDQRPDGSRMPILEPGTLSPLHVKQYGEQRREIDSALKRLKTPV